MNKYGATAISGLRKGMRQAARNQTVRKVYRRISQEFENALSDDMYNADYYNSDGSSGYVHYTREESNQNVLAFLVAKYFSPKQVVEVGCGTGFLVEALRELDIDARGFEFNQYCVDNPAPGAAGHIAWGDITRGVTAPSRSADVVIAAEVCEHLPEKKIPDVFKEFMRISRGYVFLTIPSFGKNDTGIDGWYSGKVRDEVLEDYHAKPDFLGPVPQKDLMLDSKGRPIEGHITIASYSWWREQARQAGLTRCEDLEVQINTDIARYNLLEGWDLYVFATPEQVQRGIASKPALNAQLASALENKLGLNDIEPREEHVLAMKEIAENKSK
jgi:SAM-dependent methyltransferase